MSLDKSLNEVLNELLKRYVDQSISADQLIHCIDLTLLDENASAEALKQLNDKSKSNQVAALCVFSQHLPLFSSRLDTQLATVINFPQGTEDLQKSLNDIDAAQQLGAQEIDYVLPYQAYLSGNKDQALHGCEAVSRLCNNKNLKLKIILESGAFPDMGTIYQVSRDLIEIGCDFIKTSTGKIANGASTSAVFAILSAIKDSGSSCGIKVSGGVKTIEQALNYATLAQLISGKSINSNWFRIGASSLLDELILNSR